MSSRPRIFDKAFWVAIALVVIGGYVVGRDVAFQDNARDKIQRLSMN